jgi:hypothetical protein
LVEIYDQAIGSKVNAHKYVGIQWGTQKVKTPPPAFRQFNWLKPGEYTKILEVPFWSCGENDSFWESLYQKIKRRIANRKNLKMLSILGRATLANVMIYSVPRYWVQTMAAPKWFHKCLEADVYELLWTRDPVFDAEDTGTDSRGLKWIKHHTAPLIPKSKGGAALGIGLLDWPNHVKAMQVKWLLKYLDASTSSWKTILDCWFARTSLGRAAILSNINPKSLTQSMRVNIALPPFWRQALEALRELSLTQTQLTHEGALSQPIRDNGHFPPPSIPPILRDKWELLQVTVVHNLYADREGRAPFTREDNSQYLDTETDHHYFQNRKTDNDRFLKSWEVIIDHRKEHIQSFCAVKETRTTHPPRGDEPYVRITKEGEYIQFIDGIPFEGIPNTLGELAVGAPLPAVPDNIDPSFPAKWGSGYKGPKREAFPLPDEYALDEQGLHWTPPQSKYSRTSSLQLESTNPTQAWQHGKRGLRSASATGE